MTITRAEIALRGRDETAAAFRSVVRNAETAQKQIGAKLRAAFNFVGIGTAIYGLQRAISGAIQAGDDLAKFATKSGMAAEAASELAHAAKMVDLDLGQLATGLKKMQVTLSEASGGSKTANETLKALGLTFEYLKGLSPDQQFEVIAEQISRLEDPANRTRAAVALFGRAGADLLPLFEQGAAGIRAARIEAQQLGKSFSDEDLKRFQMADDAFKRLAASSSSLADALAIKLAPALTVAADKMRDFLQGKYSGGDILKALAASPLAKVRMMVAAFNEAQGELEQMQQNAAVAAGPNTSPSRAGLMNRLPEPFGWVPELGKQAKLTKVELEALEKFQNQPTQIRNDAARMGSSIAPDISENDSAILRAMAAIREDGVAATSRVIELGEAFKIADEGAKSMAETLKDESLRTGFNALSDVIANLGNGMDDFAEDTLNAFRRIVANAITQQLFSMLGGLGNGGKDGGFLGFVGGLFSGFGGARAGGGPVSGGKSYLVGERGPEMFRPSGSGFITPNHAMAGGMTFAPVTHITVDSRTDRAAVRQDILAISSEVSRRNLEQFRDYMSRGGR